MPATQQTCGDCGDVFYGRADATYCSPACRQRSYRKRNEGERLHHLGKAPKGMRIANRLPRTIARNSTNEILMTAWNSSGGLEDVYLGEIPTDIATAEEVDEAIKNVRATLAFLNDLRRHIAGQR